MSQATLSLANGRVGMELNAQVSDAQMPLILELFTSQGCSSCPPADDLLKHVAKQGAISGIPVIPLVYHVDYWDHLGWTDPFGRKEWTQRQRTYAEKLGEGKKVYTPQLVIQGSVGEVGSKKDAIVRNVSQAARYPPFTAKIEVELDLHSLELEVDLTMQPLPAAYASLTSSADVMVALYEDGLRTDVRSGENSGRSLESVHVVRSLERAFSVPTGESNREEKRGKVRMKLAGGKWNRCGLVVFLQDGDTWRVFGGTQIQLSDDL
ncbi:hypothetical protein KFL_001650060 [Klebsormidium nitens]|uniref:DUF1223 domain-containing protein n=1 Tax=Klebsormidium nitens TaxID=105231 RepID=A0A1Y1HYX3_KLENI|nr:hypothetical protein KFL_001650060 [Klebsormidium nitens]|eukprot:GAQ83854.1 hypothetical protein KFL_001650060 [Klebsormidium nitens]